MLSIVQTKPISLINHSIPYEHMEGHCSDIILPLPTRNSQNEGHVGNNNILGDFSPTSLTNNLQGKLILLPMVIHNYSQLIRLLHTPLTYMEHPLGHQISLNMVLEIINSCKYNLDPPNHYKSHYIENPLAHARIHELEVGHGNE